MTVETLLSRLDRVRQTGRGRWIARSPAREDKNPSLSIRELDDGRVLIHDFGGASPDEVLSAVGLTWADLFPESLARQPIQERRPFTAADALRCIGFEATLVAIAASSMSEGNPLTDTDRQRLTIAASRITRALEVTE